MNYKNFGVKLKSNKIKKRIIHYQLERAVGKSTYVLVSNISPYSLDNLVQDVQVVTHVTS